MSRLGSLYSETSTVENELFHSPWRWWLSLSEKAHVTVIEFTSEIQIYEWSSFREKSAGIKHRLGVKVQSKRSKSCMALKFSKVLRKSVFSPSPFQMGAMVLWCAWLFWGNSIWAWIRTRMACMCWSWWSRWCKQLFWHLQTKFWLLLKSASHIPHTLVGKIWNPPSASLSLVDISQTRSFLWLNPKWSVNDLGF